MNRFPRSGADLIDESLALDPKVLSVVQAFARSKPWRGSIDERKEKFMQFAAALAEAASFVLPTIEFDNVELDRCSGNSLYQAAKSRIVLSGRLSVVTLLYLLGMASGMSGKRSLAWTFKVFRRCFPRSFARCQFDGFMLRRIR